MKTICDYSFSALLSSSIQHTQPVTYWILSTVDTLTEQLQTVLDINSNDFSMRYCLNVGCVKIVRMFYEAAGNGRFGKFLNAGYFLLKNWEVTVERTGTPETSVFERTVQHVPR
jgi:hypothetical protein